MSTPFMGQIEIFSFNFAPKGWTLCNGQLLPINQNQALFSLLGTMYGGNGQTTFGLPDLRGRTPISFGQQNVIGQAGGSEFVTITTQTMAQHNHLLMADVTSPPDKNTNTPGASGTTVLGNSGGQQSPGGPFNVSIYATANPTQILNPGVIGNTGGSQAHENRMPFLVLNLCIALQGIFPSQN